MLLGVLALLFSPQANAQSGFDAHVMRPITLDGDLEDPLIVRRPHTGRSSWFASGVLALAEKPVVYVRNDNSERSYQVVVGDDWVFDLSAGGEVHPRVRVEGTLPLHLTSKLSNRRLGPGLGDLRTEVRVLLLEPDKDSNLWVDTGAWLDLPTGDPTKLRGNTMMSGGAGFAATYVMGNLSLTGDLGLHIRPAAELANISGAERMQVGLAASYLATKDTALSVEMRYAAALERNDSRVGTGSPGEAFVTVRHRRPNEAMGVFGLGYGFGRGVGAANFRVILGGGFGQVKPVPEEPEEVPTEVPIEVSLVEGPGEAAVTVSVLVDGDPVGGAGTTLRRDDEDPETWLSTIEGVVKSGTAGDLWMIEASMGDCLTTEREITLIEGDNELNLELEYADALLNVLVVDENDKPVAGAPLTFHSDSPRCIPDQPFKTDNDGRLSQRIGLGAHTVLARVDGYAPGSKPFVLKSDRPADVKITLKPTKLKLDRDRITTAEEIYFEAGSAVIEKRSYSTLDEIATILKANPTWGRLRIAGHADATGSVAENLELSQKRAESVRDYLVEQGVVPDRLEAVGFGDDRPVDDNETADGRAANRRVVFKLLDLD